MFGCQEYVTRSISGSMLVKKCKIIIIVFAVHGSHKKLEVETLDGTATDPIRLFLHNFKEFSMPSVLPLPTVIPTRR